MNQPHRANHARTNAVDIDNPPQPTRAQEKPLRHWPRFEDRAFAIAIDTEGIIQKARHHLDRLWSLAREACKDEPDFDRGNLKPSIDDAVHDVQQYLYTAELYMEDFSNWVREVSDVMAAGDASEANGAPDSGVMPVARTLSVTSGAEPAVEASP